MADLAWPRQRKLLRAVNIGFNAEVYRHFKDADNDATTSISRKALRDSLLIGAKDSRTTALAKIQFFRDQVQRVHHKPAIIGTFKDNFDSLVTYKCRVELFFSQDLASVPTGDRALSAEIGWRIDETNATITRAKIETIANKIKLEFGGTTPYTWDKGKYICWYKDKENFYDFQIYALNGTMGKNLIQKIIGMNNHSYDEDLFRLTTPSKNSVNNPGSRTILGKSYKKAKWRPTARVEFSYAQLIVHELPEPLVLIDYTGTKSNPVVQVY